MRNANFSNINQKSSPPKVWLATDRGNWGLTFDPAMQPALEALQKDQPVLFEAEKGGDGNWRLTSISAAGGTVQAAGGVQSVGEAMPAPPPPAGHNAPQTAPDSREEGMFIMATCGKAATHCAPHELTEWAEQSYFAWQRIQQLRSMR